VLERALKTKLSNTGIAMIDLSSNAVPDAVAVSQDAARQPLIPTEDEVHGKEADGATIIEPGMLALNITLGPA
jgi:hypothetical protein